MSERTLNFDHLDDADRRLAISAICAARDHWREISRKPGAVNRLECREVANYYERLRVKILTPPSELPSERGEDPLVRAIGPDEASDLIVALTEVIDRHGKFPGGPDEIEQVHRWQALSERIEQAGDWEVTS